MPAPVSALANQASQKARSVGQVVGLYAALVLVGLTGAGFLVAAAYIWLASVSDPLIAALIFGGTLLLIAAILAGVLMSRAKQKQRERRQSSVNTAMLASSLSLTGTVVRILSRSKGSKLLPAAAMIATAWFMFGRGSGDSED
ncbi:phage holin family protein [Pelagibacterium montanilacus]|uniref:phage holin family protein n=1 Tax=Pelagibacterium montanilacus TaxID=2185280 RepID=UPI0013E0DCA5|nr:phage holin family protein [Pelagibacterium montanilacus]